MQLTELYQECEDPAVRNLKGKKAKINGTEQRAFSRRLLDFKKLNMKKAGLLADQRQHRQRILSIVQARESPQVDKGTGGVVMRQVAKVEGVHNTLQWMKTDLHTDLPTQVRAFLEDERPSTYYVPLAAVFVWSADRATLACLLLHKMHGA